MKKLASLGDLHENLAKALREQKEFEDLNERYSARVQKKLADKCFTEISINLSKNQEHEKNYKTVRDEFARRYLKLYLWKDIDEVLLKLYEEELEKEDMSPEEFGNFVDELYALAVREEARRYKNNAAEKTSESLSSIKQVKRAIVKFEKETALAKSKLRNNAPKLNKSFNKIYYHFLDSSKTK